MGQKTNPIGLRLGIIRPWDANWFDERNVAEKLEEDVKVRSYIKSRLKKAGVARIIVERTAKQLRITINTSRPGVIIGRSGKDITQLEEELKKVTGKDIPISSEMAQQVAGLIANAAPTIQPAPKQEKPKA